MDFEGNMDASSESSSELEFDSDLDRQMDSLFNPGPELQNSDYDFDSDLDRQMDHLFTAEPQPGPSRRVFGKRKTLQTRRERHAKRQRMVQTGSGVQPQLEFDLVREFEPEHLPRFHRVVSKRHYRLKHNLAEVDMLEMGDAIDDLFRKFMQPFLQAADDQDQVSLTVRQGRIRDIYVSYRKVNFDIQEIVNRLESVQQSQSGDSFLLDGELEIEVAITRKISGGRGTTNSRSRAPQSVSELSNNKKSVVKINNTDNACGYWAVALAKFKTTNPSTREWDLVKKNKARRLEGLARDLCAGAQTDYDTPMDRNAMKKIDSFLKPDFKLTVVDAQNKKNRLFTGEQALTDLFIEYIDNHYNTITSIKAYVGSQNFCIPCFKPFKRVGSHRCNNMCSACFGMCNSAQDKVECNDCHRLFNGQLCLDMHKTNSCCRHRKRCPSCEVEYAGRYEHRCGHTYCDKCKSYSAGQHHCFITSKDADKLQDDDGKAKFFVSFDIESYQEEASGKQFANLLICIVVCDICYDHQQKTKIGNICDECGAGRHVFEGNDCIKKFGKFLYTDLAKRAEKKKARILAFAHNFGGFDGHFIMNDLLNRDYQPEVVMTGSRILKLDVGNVRFIDTLSLFQQPLASLPKAFGFQDVVVKGYFPHKFNKPNNYDTTLDHIPDLQYFDPDQCKTPEERSALTLWHSQQTGPWDFRTEIIKYCDSDVKVLLAALMSFRKLFQEITKLDPVSRNFTLASIGLEYYRSAFLNDQTLGITPVAGYSLRNNSMIGSAWLSWIERANSLQLERESRIGPYFADGYDPQNDTYYEFNGCRWHGCPKCYKEPGQTLSLEDGDRTVRSRYADYQKKKAYYSNHGKTLVEVWECDFVRQRQQDPELNAFIVDELDRLKTLKEIGGAVIKEAFFGGRTDNMRFFHHASEEESIQYKDVTSEYPFVLKFKDYPIGHPTVISNDFDMTLSSYFGFIKCTIVPPRGLHIPVLPKRVGGKLVFPLCSTCAALEFHGQCQHNDVQRQMTGTWTSMELQTAIRKNYTVKTVYEVYHYERRSSEMFRGYINSWLKIKQEASGWPPYCTTDELKDEYIRKYYEKEGVQLDKTKIEVNPGKRSIAKLMLNSFWGKLSQRPNLPQVKICKEYHDYWSLVEDDSIELTGEFSPNPDTIVVSYQLKDDEAADPGNTSIAIASFVTSYARLHLYKFMEQVDSIGHDRLLYFDTDSIIFVQKPGDPVVETGDYLGDLTDELPPGARCTRFVSGGPKNYGYQYHLADGTLKTVIKTKGMRHNCQTMSMFGIDRMEEIIRDFAQQSEPRCSREVQLPQTVFRSAWNNHDVRTITSNKRYRVVSNKKWILGNETLPFGF